MKTTKPTKTEAKLNTAKDAQPMLPSPGCGAPPDRAGLFWVRDPEVGLLLAVCTGTPPFLTVTLIDPFGDAERVKPGPKGLAKLTWHGEIVIPYIPRGDGRDGRSEAEAEIGGWS